MGVRNLINRSLGDNRIIESKSSLDAGIIFPYPPNFWVHPLSGMTYDGSNNLSQWNDASGLNNHLIQGTGANQPLRVANELNGYDGVVCTKDKFMQTAGNVTGGGGNLTCIVVVDGKTVPNTFDTFLGIPEYTGSWISTRAGQFDIYFNSGEHFQQYWIDIGGSYANVYPYRIFGYIRDVTGNTCSGYVGSNLITTNIASTAFSDDKYTLGNANVNYGRCGGTMEIITMPSAIPYNHYKLLVQQLAIKYNIQA